MFNFKHQFKLRRKRGFFSVNLWSAKRIFGRHPTHPLVTLHPAGTKILIRIEYQYYNAQKFPKRGERSQKLSICCSIESHWERNHRRGLPHLRNQPNRLRHLDKEKSSAFKSGKKW